MAHAFREAISLHHFNFIFKEPSLTAEFLLKNYTAHDFSHTHTKSLSIRATISNFSLPPSTANNIIFSLCSQNIFCSKHCCYSYQLWILYFSIFILIVIQNPSWDCSFSFIPSKPLSTVLFFLSFCLTFLFFLPNSNVLIHLIAGWFYLWLILL